MKFNWALFVFVASPIMIDKNSVYMLRASEGGHDKHFENLLSITTTFRLIEHKSKSHISAINKHPKNCSRGPSQREMSMSGRTVN